MRGGTLDYPPSCSCCPAVEVEDVTDSDVGDAGHSSDHDPNAEDLIHD